MALKTMYPGMVNSPSTKLKQDINEAATIIPVEDLSVFPPPPNIAVIGIDEAAETILYAAIDTAASTLTGCTRALEGTAKTWPATTPIARNFTNFDYNILRENMTDVTATADYAKTTADNAIPKAGGTMTGALTLQKAEDAEFDPKVCLHVPHNYRPNTDAFYVDTFGNVMINGTLIFGQDSGWIHNNPFMLQSDFDECIKRTDDGILRILSNRENVITILKNGDAGLCVYSVPITLPADPTENLHAATKQYVDSILRTPPIQNGSYQYGTEIALEKNGNEQTVEIRRYDTNPNPVILYPYVHINSKGAVFLGDYTNWQNQVATLGDLATLEARIAALENK